MTVDERSMYIARESSTGKRIRRVEHPRSFPLSLSLSFSPARRRLCCYRDLPENIGTPVMIQGSTSDGLLESRLYATINPNYGEQQGERQRQRGRGYVHERGVARARRRCFERRLARIGRGTGQIRASNEPPCRGLKIDISVFAPSSPRAVRRGAVRRGAARRFAGFRRLER